MGEAVRTGLFRPSACDPHDDSWVAPCTFYCRACMIDKPGESGYTSAHFLRASFTAAKYGGQESARPVVVFGLARARQNHHRVGSGGVYADHGWAHFVDAVHGADQRWAFRSHLARFMQWVSSSTNRHYQAGALFICNSIQAND